MPGPEACACTSATRAPLLAPSTQTVPSLCARNRSVPPPPEVSDAQSTKRLRPVAPSTGNRRTSRPSSASTRTTRSGVLGSANDVPCIIDAAHVAKSRGAGECA